MAKDTTPTTWPQDPETGILEEVRLCLARLFTGFAWPRGKMDIPLAKGACLSLDGAGRTMVECLDGQAWATGDEGGHDVLLTKGSRATFDRPGRVVVTAFTGGATLRFCWK